MIKKMLSLLVLFSLAACSSGQPSQVPLSSTVTVSSSLTPLPLATATVLPSPTEPPTVAPTRAPTATLEPTPVPLETLVEAAGPLCENAFSKPVTTGPVTYPVMLMVDNNPPGTAESHWIYEDSTANQLAFLNAKSATDVKTVVCVWETTTKVGTYTDGSSAYQVNWNVRLVQWPEGTVVGQNSLTGEGAPAVKTGTGPARGQPPTFALLQWIVPLMGVPGLLHSQSEFSGPVSVTFSPDGTQLASGAPGIVELWDIATSKLIRTLGPVGYVQQIAWSPNGAWVAVAAGEGILIWDPESGQRVAEMKLDYPEKFKSFEASTGIAWSPDSTKIASASRLGTLFIWEASTGKQLQSLSGYETASFLHTAASKVAWSPDGKRIALITKIDRFTIWDAESGQQLTEFSVKGTARANEVHATDVAWSPDGKRIASVVDELIYNWDVASGGQIANFGNKARVYSLTWSPDGLMLASTSENTVKIWNAIKGGQLQKLEGYAAEVTDVAWSPDGRWLASGSKDGFIKLWDMTSIK